MVHTNMLYCFIPWSPVVTSEVLYYKLYMCFKKKNHLLNALSKNMYKTLCIQTNCYTWLVHPSHPASYIFSLDLSVQDGRRQNCVRLAAMRMGHRRRPRSQNHVHGSTVGKNYRPGDPVPSYNICD